MKRIAILSASVRTGRLSHRVALYLENYFRQNALADTELLDLKAYDFPLFHERLAMQERPSDMLIDFTNRFNDADGLIIVSPVYNASYPAALKNVIDLYYKEWKHKPVGIVSVTSGKVPGIATVQQTAGTVAQTRCAGGSGPYDRHQCRIGIQRAGRTPLGRTGIRPDTPDA